MKVTVLALALPIPGLLWFGAASHEPSRGDWAAPPPGHLTFSSLGPPSILNPRTEDNLYPSPIEYVLFSRLVAVDAHDHLVPDALARLPTTKNGLVRDGGQTLVLVLKHNLRWSSGRNITSVSVDRPDRAILHLRSALPTTLSLGLPPLLPAGRSVATTYSSYATGTSWSSGPFRVKSYSTGQDVGFGPNSYYRRTRDPSSRG